MDEVLSKAEHKKDKKKEKQKTLPEIGKEHQRKRKREEGALEESKIISSEGEPQLKKKKKNKTGFLDPDEEPLLSDQARKALVYAFTQFRKPSEWKFHKARQNWIIRNVWSSNVPDSQVPLVLKYLSNVQGSVRQNLTKTCTSIIEEASKEASALPAPEAAKDTEQDTTEAVSQPKSHNLKTLRAQALLAVLNGE
ncbi:hypothetical protein BDP27DRAFT_1313338 [Rhodocollybia butyracea]|uniref:WKF domain-containing protein n=1 Tax=Rhodocollybia butyracea TaxID=206335 RepID=A0A9P5UEP5_9AGAR|nr:hypothetical protein BDP27DRAFT_1313338 [Rhodocollybia butyracea]